MCFFWLWLSEKLREALSRAGWNPAREGEADALSILGEICEL